jgi:hypothetical protein
MGGIIGNLENANASITLDNSDGLLSDLFLPPPIGIRVVITGSGMHDVPYFTGIITGITIGEAISLNLEAGERIPLSAQIPLLSTTQLPGYRTDQSIPIVYGTVTLQPVSADSTGYIYLAAGHPCAQVEAVMIDNAEIQAWSWKNSINEAGTMATISLTTSLQANQRITCRVRGKQSLRSGALITNPADVVWDILANVCGISIEYSELDRFRTDMAAKGITLSGAIVDARKTIRSTLDEIMISCGSVWSGQVPGIALDYLGAIQEPPSAVITANQINSLQISAKLSEIATSLKMSYAYNFSQNQHTKTALFDCAAGIKQLGRTIVDLEASWLSSTRNAVILGEQYLQWKATPQWSISISTGGEHKSIRPGQWITAIHPHLPGGQITSLCINAELDITKGGINLLFIVPAGVVYPVSLGSLSTAFDPQTMEGTQIQFANGQATITFMDDKGSALAGAQVTLDGSQTKTTDKNGKVSFSTARGMHNIKVVATGYQPMEGSIEI